MKTVKFKILCLAILLSNLNLSAQITYFISGSGNYPILPNQERIELIEPSATIMSGRTFFKPDERKYIEHYDSKPGINISAGLEKKVKNKFQFEIGLKFSNINYHRYENIEYTHYADDSQSIFPDSSYVLYLSNNTSDEIGKTNLYYFSLPLQMKYSILPRFFIGGGFSYGFSTFSKRTEAANEYDMASSQFIIKNEDTVEGIRKDNFSANVNLEYMIFKNIWLNTRCQYSFTPIYEKEEQFAGKAKLMTLDFGLKYKFGKE